MAATRILLLSCIAALAANSPVLAQATNAPPVLAFATKHVEKEPSVENRLGLAEMKRAHGLIDAFKDDLQKLTVTIPTNDARAADVQELACWRMLPVVHSQRETLRQHVAALKKAQPGNGWAAVWELYLLAGESDRAALLSAIERMPKVMPARFPGIAGETAHWELLRELGIQRVQAGLDVIAAREHEPLHALRDLDRALSREAEFHLAGGQDAQAKAILAVRDRLRLAYRSAARHLVEKLFALHLLGDSKERDALLAQAKALPYLHDRQKLASVLERMDEELAWTRLIEPMLVSELQVIAQPPEIAKLPLGSIAQLAIKADKKSQQGKGTHYKGNVRFRLQGIEIVCGELTLLRDEDSSSVLLTGTDKVRLRGFSDYPHGVFADRVVYQAEIGTFTLNGDIRLHAYDKTLKLRSCTLTQRGELRDARSLFDDYRQLFTLDAKLAMLPRLVEVYSDTELPAEVRYLLAMNLLRPHLDWRAPYLPTLLEPFRRFDPIQRVKEERKRAFLDYFSPWREAFGGEPWMSADISKEAQDAFRTSLRAWYKRVLDDPGNREAKLPDIPIPDTDLYFWRIRDLRHADIARVKTLLSGIHTDELNAKASRWREEIGRNNTVLTFDIPGAASLGKPHRMLMDARNAEVVRFKLYRVERPEELLFATRAIGKDFIYRDHGLDHDRLEKILERLGKDRIRDITQRLEHFSKEDAFQPNWKPSQLVHQWDAALADLKVHRTYHGRYRDWEDDNWHDDADADYFDDACSTHQQRLEKEYRPDDENQLSSWQCDRIVEIPEKKLNEVGAYVLIAESNGISAHVPIVVEPISLTLRRCRDGVFVLANDAAGKAPLAGAQVHARGILGEAKTDEQGVAFARVYAAGDRAIVVHHQGRYAIGGFGQVFEGIYSSPFDDDQRWQRDRMKRSRDRKGEAKEAFAAVYQDQHVVAAYTDRPTYRLGQDVQFKLIVRKLAPANPNAERAASFRAEEFDRATKMELPDLDRPVRYSITDPKGREIANGVLPLSEFGTAAGKVTLNAETLHASYTFRVCIANQWRIVPEVFAVKHYRRPNFEVLVEGVPAKLMKPETLTLKITSRYYFGPPVPSGEMRVQVVGKDFGKSLVEMDEKLDAQGHAKLNLRLPRALEPGKYHVVCSVTDESGRTVSTTSPFTLSGPDAPAGASGFDGLPRFVAVGEELQVATTAKAIRAEQQITSLMFAAKDGVATLKLPAPGWYRLHAGDVETTIFAYGGSDHPRRFVRPDDERDEVQPHGLAPKWVNLSDFALEEHDHLSRWEKPAQHLYALFDRQSLDVGAKLRLLVYVPHKQAKMLFTMEGRTILDYAIVNAKENGGAYQIVELPMKQRYYPNIYLQGRILSGELPPRAIQGEQEKEIALKMLELDQEDIDPRWCRVDLRQSKGGEVASALNVRIETEQANYRPGDSVRATVKVTDSGGRPQSAEISFAAIDESVFAFGEDGLDSLPSFFRSPYETRRFLPKVWRVGVGKRPERAQALMGQRQALEKLQQAMKSIESMTKSLQSLESSERNLTYTAVPLPRLAGEMPAGQIPLARLREHFQETAAWLPQMRTNDDGIARINFTLPDSLTRYRLTSIALTKTTDVGIGRARITAAMPLAVQVFVPRFAVERDRVQAVAVVHNHADKVRDCQIAWQIEGARIDTAEPALMDWKLVNESGKLSGTGTLRIAAASSAKLGLWLNLDQVGTAKITFRAVAGKDGDAEVHSLPVLALGKPHEVSINGPLAAIPIDKAAVNVVAGKFTKEGRIQLPKGFLASEMHLSLACSDTAQALDGLDYLIDYPHGCIEQTMSRFLPAVMIQHATRTSPVKLRPEIEAKLPDVLQTGLTRLYGHQHGDGSWGWFAKDSRNFAMSVYVVYGLARCQAAGTIVDAEVLRNGCRYLREELRTNKQDPELAARAWYALALAGHVDATDLAAWAKQALAQSSRGDVCANLALACRSAGLVELGEQAYRKTKQWQPHDTEAAALKLNTQIAYGASYGECRAAADLVLARRHGTIWNHTRDTSWAIESLANLLGFLPEKNLVRKVEVTIAGKKVLDVTDARELRKLVHRVVWKAGEAPQTNGAEIRMHVDSDEPVYVAFRAVGVQRQDAVQPAGNKVRLTRTLESLDGQALRGPVTIGQVVRVRLRLDLAEREQHVMIEERRPTLCEFAGDYLGGSGARAAVHQEFRDDRLCLFFSSLNAGSHEIVYYLRAETPGVCTVLPGCAYPMYNDKNRGETGSSKMEVTVK
jgi:uncharacterized protein YfaS (alpha-2-macroglobulin family)